jgi:hypothetical protein
MKHNKRAINAKAISDSIAIVNAKPTRRDKPEHKNDKAYTRVVTTVADLLSLDDVAKIQRYKAEMFGK